MNPKSLQKTLPGERLVKRALLSGYARKVNVPINGYLYLNLVPNKEMTVSGVLIPVSFNELALLKEREPGYACVDISSAIKEEIDGIVFVFIAPDRSYLKLRVPRSYLLTCLVGVLPNEKEKWLEETIIENEIEEDALNPVYVNAIF